MAARSATIELVSHTRTSDSARPYRDGLFVSSTGVSPSRRVTSNASTPVPDVLASTKSRWPGPASAGHAREDQLSTTVPGATTTGAGDSDCAGTPRSAWNDRE